MSVDPPVVTVEPGPSVTVQACDWSRTSITWAAGIPDSGIGLCRHVAPASVEIISVRSRITQSPPPGNVPAFPTAPASDRAEGDGDGVVLEPGVGSGDRSGFGENVALLTNAPV